MAPDHDYEAGLRDGRLQAVENMLADHGDRLDQHSSRLSKLEKVSYIVLGVVLVIQFYPALQAFFS